MGLVSLAFKKHCFLENNLIVKHFESGAVFCRMDEVNSGHASMFISINLGSAHFHWLESELSATWRYGVGVGEGVSFPNLIKLSFSILRFFFFLSLSNIYFYFLLFILFFYFYFFNFILFNFTILYWFCHISKWICHRYTCVPHPEPSSLLPPHTIPLGHPRAPAPSIQYRASNLDWRFISYMILYISQVF